MRFFRIFVLIFVLISALLASVAGAHASAVLLLEEPFGHFGALTATGHAAVYLPRICAASPVSLRRCEPGETGVVISRYKAVAGYDWIAIPLVPYLYAVEAPGDVPLFANGKLVAFLRNQYRRKHLESVAPDSENGEPPSGNWTQLVGSSYDRTIYSYQVETSPEQDDALIAHLNSRSNRSHFNLMTHNCADFARGVMNFYYPRSLHRSIVADLGVTTPKQLARTLVKFSRRNPQLESTRFVIPQVPGSVQRSTPVYGVLESFLKSKKYLLPLAAFHPIITGGIAVAYLGTGRFDPAKEALVLDSSNRLRRPIGSDKRETYEEQLKSLMARLDITSRESAANAIPFLGQRFKSGAWERLQAQAEPHLDASGHPVLQVQLGTQLVNVGLSRDNILQNSESPQLAQEILTYRLHNELRRGVANKTAESDLLSDWKLLRKTVPQGEN